MTCEVAGCEKPARHRGLCSTHYKRWWRHGDPTKTLTPTRGFERIQCIADDVVPCENMSVYSCGLCENHYEMQRNYGRTKRIIREKGLGTYDVQGYVILTIEGKRVYEHIHIAEKALGKPLPAGAVVHHMNRDKGDNFSYLNLVVCPNQEYHMLLHSRMKELGL